ncbi:MAG: HD-GYP domain-containing protein [Lachnospiraceae bacterium]|nr:HD-GYP domain-containing protein [Lachnospiraceae bacterium]
MRRERKRSTAFLQFSSVLAVVLIIFAFSVIRTKSYNQTVHDVMYSGDELFSADTESTKEVSVKAIPRGSTWSKIFYPDVTPADEFDHQAFTYDFSILNNTSDEIKDFKFRLNFDKEVFLQSAWNGALELHQVSKGGEYVATVPDLRDFDPNDYSLDIINIDGEILVRMKPGDYLIYYPSTNENAMEVPIEPEQGTVPGIIMYLAIGEELRGSEIELTYTFHRLLTSDVFFWVAVVGFAVWLIGLLIYLITSAQIKKYKIRHERDNEIIRESIETFTGFIDAKDPYTNGHSNRVADYTKAIAKEMGYSGEELDRVYYVALLHDCGKIGVPDNILGKPDRLTDEEFSIIKSHTIRGGEILSSFKSLKDVDEGARYHHERYDGKGYPEGLAGEDIPEIARMICVADSFDAMNSNRVYRKKLTSEMIREEIEKNKGKQFDPKIADIFLRLLKEGKI